MRQDLAKIFQFNHGKNAVGAKTITCTFLSRAVATTLPTATSSQVVRVEKRPLLVLDLLFHDDYE